MYACMKYKVTWACSSFELTLVLRRKWHEGGGYEALLHMRLACMVPCNAWGNKTNVSSRSRLDRLYKRLGLASFNERLVSGYVLNSLGLVSVSALRVSWAILSHILVWAKLHAFSMLFYNRIIIIVGKFVYKSLMLYTIYIYVGIEIYCFPVTPS